MICSGRLRAAGHVACVGEKRNAYRIWEGGTETKRPLKGSRRGLWHNIEKDLQWINMDWIYLSYDRDIWKALAKVVMNIWFHKRR